MIFTSKKFEQNWPFKVKLLVFRLAILFNDDIVQVTLIYKVQNYVQNTNYGKLT